MTGLGFTESVQDGCPGNWQESISDLIWMSAIVTWNVITEKERTSGMRSSWGMSPDLSLWIREQTTEHAADTLPFVKKFKLWPSGRMLTFTGCSLLQNSACLHSADQWPPFKHWISNFSTTQTSLFSFHLFGPHKGIIEGLTNHAWWWRSCVIGFAHSRKSFVLTSLNSLLTGGQSTWRSGETALRNTFLHTRCVLCSSK